ncbi:MAG: NAD(+)/NADH kinase [Anaerolineales bacterium]|nr:NAD(+)/NADH kinase [Anaerolineales bacterium]
MITGQAASVGIIANPASGTDIRRLVALGAVYGTQEKVNIVQRILAGLLATGVEDIYLGRDSFGITQTAVSRLPESLSAIRDKVHLLDMPVEHSSADSTRAVQEMEALGVGCIVALGGDGTCRAVAKACGQVPLLPISTGTNNVVPYLVEGTVAGLAAGFVACFPELKEQVACQSKWLEVLAENYPPDMALVDVAVVEGVAVGSRAVWDPDDLFQVILTRAEPSATGMSSLGGFLSPISPLEPRGLSLILGKSGDTRVIAPLAPGLMVEVGVVSVRQLAIGQSEIIHGGKKLLALDGEREIALRSGQSAEVILRDRGPWLVDVFSALKTATSKGVFIRKNRERDHDTEL